MKKLVAVLATLIVFGIVAVASGSTVVRHTHRFVLIRTDTGAISKRLCAQCSFSLAEQKPNTFRYRVRYPSGRVVDHVIKTHSIGVSVSRERRP